MYLLVIMLLVFARSTHRHSPRPFVSGISSLSISSCLNLVHLKPPRKSQPGRVLLLDSLFNLTLLPRLAVQCPAITLLSLGHVKDYSFIDADILSKLGVQRDGLYLYRHVLPPFVRNIAFVGVVSSFLCLSCNCDLKHARGWEVEEA